MAGNRLRSTAGPTEVARLLGNHGDGKDTTIKTVIVRSALIGAVAALAASAAQWLITGDINPAISGGVAGAVAGATAVTANRKKFPASE